MTPVTLASFRWKFGITSRPLGVPFAGCEVGLMVTYGIPRGFMTYQETESFLALRYPNPNERRELGYKVVSWRKVIECTKLVIEVYTGKRKVENGCMVLSNLPSTEYIPRKSYADLEEDFIYDYCTHMERLELTTRQRIRREESSNFSHDERIRLMSLINME